MHNLYTLLGRRQLFVVSTQQRKWFSFYKKVNQHLGSNACKKTEVSKGQICKEKVPGGMKLRFSFNKDYYEQVSKYAEKVNDQENIKK